MVGCLTKDCRDCQQGGSRQGVNPRNQCSILHATLPGCPMRSPTPQAYYVLLGRSSSLLPWS